MRILYHSWEFGPGTGGIGQYLYQIASGVHAFGHEVVVVTGLNGNNIGVEKNAFGPVHRIYTRDRIGSLQTADETLRLAEKYNIDVIEGTDHLGECATLIGRKHRPKIMIKYHGCQIIKALTSAEVIYPWQRLTIAVALWKIRHQCQVEKRCVEEADAAMMPSEKIRLDLASQGIHFPGLLKLIPNMISSLPEIRDAGEESSTPTLLFVGRIEARKGIQFLPDILRAVNKSFPNAVLEIAGGDQFARGLGSLKKWLQRQFGSLIDRVRFLGALSPEEIDKAYRRSWVLVFPTKWDNFPMAVLEAMAYAKPIVTTFNGGMPEMLAGTGSLIAAPDSREFTENILRLLSDKILRLQIGRACRQRVLDNYMPKQVIPEYLRFIEAAI